jgi:hypothetical protein
LSLLSGFFIHDNDDGGIFTLANGRYEEDLLYAGKGIFKRKIRMLVEINHDPLIQKWPANGNWETAEKSNIEKYIRLK